MKIFFQSDFKDRFQFPDEMTEALSELFAHHHSLQELLEKLFTFFRGRLDYDFLMLSFTNQEKEKSRYYMFPRKDNGKDSFLQIETPIKLQASLYNTPQCAVRIGSRVDTVPSISILKKMMPTVDFSSLRFRAVNKYNMICGLMFISKKKNSFTREHAHRLFGLEDILTHYFNNMPNWDDSFFDENAEQQMLPLTSLPGMKSTVDLIWKVAKQNCPVLLLGETGTGKEGVADAIYRASERGFNTYVKVNCGCIPDTLIDSELFGHEKGAFTGAIHMVQGRIEQAHLGVLLLDELGELPLPAQTRLLRVLQEGTLYRVGGRESISVNVRIIAATHRDIPKMVKEGTFREDLFYRLNVFPIQIPPLRQRPEDIPLLLKFFIQKKARQQDCPIPEISQENMDALCSYAWPGNIRELQNAVERAFILWGGNTSEPFVVSVDPLAMTRCSTPTRIRRVEEPSGREPENVPFDTLETAVRKYILRALIKTHGRISGEGGTAELLGVHPNTLRSKLKKLSLDRHPSMLKKGGSLEDL